MAFRFGRTGPSLGVIFDVSRAVGDEFNSPLALDVLRRRSFGRSRPSINAALTLLGRGSGSDTHISTGSLYEFRQDFHRKRFKALAHWVELQ